MLHHLVQCALTEVDSLRPEVCREEHVPVKKTGLVENNASSLFSVPSGPCWPLSSSRNTPMLAGLCQVIGNHQQSPCTMKEKAPRPECSIRLRAMRWFLGSVLEEANKLPLRVWYRGRGPTLAGNIQGFLGTWLALPSWRPFRCWFVISDPQPTWFSFCLLLFTVLMYLKSAMFQQLESKLFVFIFWSSLCFFPFVNEEKQQF